MFTISSYSFHALVSRFVRLWRYVNIVSDWLTLLLGLLCCQCGLAMPISSLSSYSSKHSDILQKQQVNVDLACGEPLQSQHLIIDFTPPAEDNVETSAKCSQFWQFITSQPQLENNTAKPVNSTSFEALSRATVRDAPFNLVTVSTEHMEFPATHAIKKIDAKGV